MQSACTRVHANEIDHRVVALCGLARVSSPLHYTGIWGDIYTSTCIVCRWGVGWAPGEGRQYASAWLQTSNRVFNARTHDAVLLPPSPFEALSCRGDRCQTGFRARIECHRAGIDLARRVNFPQWSLKCWLPPPHQAGKYGSMLGICRSVDQLHFRNQFQNQTCAPFFLY